MSGFRAARLSLEQIKKIREEMKASTEWNIVHRDTSYYYVR